MQYILNAMIYHSEKIESEIGKGKGTQGPGETTGCT